MNSKRTRLSIAAGIAAAAIASTGIAVAAASSPASAPKPATRTSGPATAKSWTPDDCIRLNGGDYTACNVGNSGRGDAVYRPVHAK